MNVLLLLPTILSCILLAAHYLRWNLPLLTVICLILPFLLFVKKSWIRRFFQVTMVFSAVVWTRTLIVLYSARQAAGQPGGRLIIILSAVILLALFAAGLFETRRLKDRY